VTVTDVRVVIAFEPPGPLLNLNDRDGIASHARLVAEWRTMAYFYACAALPVGPAKRRRNGRQRVASFLPVVGERRRDPHNFVPTVKAVVDGFTDAGLWPDDSEAFVTVGEPRLMVGAREAVFVIQPG
jgi:crossover junction endodeoxyribonuclease RusA